MLKNRNLQNYGRALLCLFWHIFTLSISHANAHTTESQPTPGDFNREIINHFLSSGEKGILISVLGDPEFKTTRLQRSFQLEFGQYFSIKILIHSKANRPLKYKLFSLIDYQQIAFKLNGNTATSHVIDMPSDEEKTFSLILPRLSDGKHDFLILFKQVSDKNISRGELPFASLSWRAVLNVSRDHTFPEAFYADVEQKDGAENSNRVFPISFQSAGCKTNCSISASPAIVMGGGNKGKDAKFGIVLFDENNQVAIHSNNHSPAYFYRAAIGKTHLLSLPIKLIKRQKKHLLWGALIINPFTELETINETLSTEANEVITSNTIAN